MPTVPEKIAKLRGLLDRIEGALSTVEAIPSCSTGPSLAEWQLQGILDAISPTCAPDDIRSVAGPRPRKRADSQKPLAN